MLILEYDHPYAARNDQLRRVQRGRRAPPARHPEFLAGDERSVSEIVDALELEQPSVSKHLRVLREVGLVGSRRDGRRILYSANLDAIRPLHEWTSRFERYSSNQLQRIKERAESTS